MATLVADCPRCGCSKMTFDVTGSCPLVLHPKLIVYEAFSVCRSCKASTVFTLGRRTTSTALLRGGKYDVLDGDPQQQPLIHTLSDDLTNEFKNGGHVSQKDEASTPPPEHLPSNIEAAFREGAKCLAVKCPNAAATMFRLCVDLATKPLLPDENQDARLHKALQNSLGYRLKWLFKNDKLPQGLQELSTCIKDHGNDGAHEGCLIVQEAEDMLEFTRLLLERLFTEHRRIEIAKEKRAARGAKAQNVDAKGTAKPLEADAST